MPFDAQGRWVPEDDGVASRVSALTSGDSAYIQQAREAGKATANRRGLLNSSMAAGASEGAAIGAALPIASQEAQQIYGKNTVKMSGDYDMDKTRAGVASQDRATALGAQVNTDKSYLDAFGAIAGNKDIPAGSRTAYLNNLLSVRNSGYDMIQQTYGIQLNWSGKPSAPSPATPAAPAAPAATPTPVPATGNGTIPIPGAIEPTYLPWGYGAGGNAFRRQPTA